MTHSTIKKISLFLTTILIVFLIWIIISSTKHNEIIYPTIDLIWTSFLNIFIKSNLIALLHTFLRVLSCVGISLGLSLFLNIIYIRFPKSYYLFSPVLTFFKTVPFICISLFVILLFKNTTAVYVIGCCLIVPICHEGIKSGIDNFNNNLMDEVKLLDVSFSKKVFNVFIPLIMPNILLVVLQSFGMGFKVILMGEYFVQLKKSVGLVIYQAKANLEMDALIAWSILIVIIVSVIEILIRQISQRLIYKY